MKNKDWKDKYKELRNQIDFLEFEKIMDMEVGNDKFNKRNNITNDILKIIDEEERRKGLFY